MWKGFLLKEILLFPPKPIIVTVRVPGSLFVLCQEDEMGFKSSLDMHKFLLPPIPNSTSLKYVKDFEGNNSSPPPEGGKVGKVVAIFISSREVRGWVRFAIKKTPRWWQIKVNRGHWDTDKNGGFGFSLGPEKSRFRGSRAQRERFNESCR